MTADIRTDVGVAVIRPAKRSRDRQPLCSTFAAAAGPRPSLLACSLIISK
jgi:hypothetical protein